LPSDPQLSQNLAVSRLSLSHFEQRMFPHLVLGRQFVQ
jgi:hypothetical protein